MIKKSNKGTILHLLAVMSLLFLGGDAQAQAVRVEINGQISVPTLAQPISDVLSMGVMSNKAGNAYTVEKYSNSNGGVVVVVSYC